VSDLLIDATAEALNVSTQTVSTDLGGLGIAPKPKPGKTCERRMTARLSTKRATA
jgi:hypothetical protein